MNTTQATRSTRIKVGIFTALGILLIGAMTVYVNHKPYWWRSCQLVKISVDDANGLKMKSPIRSLGIDIGYLQTVDLAETHVALGICITAPIEILPSTRAYIRGEGFLGDKFVELKPVRYLGTPSNGADNSATASSTPTQAPTTTSTSHSNSDDATGGNGSPVPMPSSTPSANQSWADFLIPSAYAEESAQATSPQGASPKTRNGREIPVGEQSQDVQALVNRVDSLVNEMTGLTNNLKQALNPEELKLTMRQLNRTLENASRTLSPESGLNQTAQRTLAKLEDAIEQMRDMMTRINKGEGSVGRLLNDPSYAEQIHQALDNLNHLLSKVNQMRFVVDLGAAELPAYDGSRGWFRLQIWPKVDRYYELGISFDPRGKQTVTHTTSVVNGVSTHVDTTQIEETGILFTALLGKVYFNRLDLAAGALNGDGDISVGLNLGPNGNEQWINVRSDTYSRSGIGSSIEDRLSVRLRPLPGFQGVYVDGGIESFRAVNGHVNYFYGAGLSFDDDDIKLLFALR